MYIEIEKVSQAGNNCLVDLRIDGVRVNPSGPLQMSPHEFETLSTALRAGMALVNPDFIVSVQT